MYRYCMEMAVYVVVFSVSETVTVVSAYEQQLTYLRIYLILLFYCCLRYHLVSCSVLWPNCNIHSVYQTHHSESVCEEVDKREMGQKGRVNSRYALLAISKYSLWLRYSGLIGDDWLQVPEADNDCDPEGFLRWFTSVQASGAASARNWSLRTQAYAYTPAYVTYVRYGNPLT